MKSALSVAINRASEAHRANGRSMPPLYDTAKAAAETFAQLFGWRLMPAPFSLRALGRGRQHDGRRSWHQVPTGLPHADYFRNTAIPAAIVWHAAQPLELAEGLVIAALPIMSWRTPGAVPTLIARPLELEAVLARLAYS